MSMPTIYPATLVEVAEQVALRNPQTRFQVVHNPACRPPRFKESHPNVTFAQSLNVPIGQLVLIDTNERGSR